MKTPQIDFRYTPLSDETVVKALIQNRIMLDPCAGGDMSQDAVLTYITLDETIKSAGLSPRESSVVRYIMDGCTITDIAQVCGGVRGTYCTLYIRAVAKITAMAKKLWACHYGDMAAEGICYDKRDRAHSQAGYDILREPDRQGDAAQ